MDEKTHVIIYRVRLNNGDVIRFNEEAIPIAEEPDGTTINGGAFSEWLEGEDGGCDGDMYCAVLDEHSNDQIHGGEVYINRSAIAYVGVSERWVTDDELDEIAKQDGVYEKGDK